MGRWTFPALKDMGVNHLVVEIKKQVSVYMGWRRLFVFNTLVRVFLNKETHLGGASMHPLPEFLTLKEIVFFSRRSRTTIYKDIYKRGLLKRCPNTGRNVIVHHDEFLRFMGVKNIQLPQAA
jgi:hypothetical protein